MSDLTLQDLIRLEEPNVDNIKFRIARHVFPRTVSRNDVLRYESLLKNKLGSRAFGLNEN